MVYYVDGNEVKEREFYILLRELSEEMIRFVKDIYPHLDFEEAVDKYHRVNMLELKTKNAVECCGHKFKITKEEGEENE